MKAVLRILLPLLVIALGAVAMNVLVKAKPKPDKRTVEETGVPVVVQKAVSGSHPVVIHAHGSVVPAQQVVVQAEVTGRVVWQNPELVPGGRFDKGKLLVRLDARDYVLRAEQQSANVDRAELELKLEGSRKVIAEQEWQIIGEDQNATEEGRRLALREPQLQTAQTNLEAAKKAKAQAELAVDKTAINAPFNAMVQTETVDVGQLVGPQTPLATLVGTDAFWVQVSVPMEKLSSFDIPGMNAQKDAGSTVRVWQDLGSDHVEREGKVVRLLGDLDPVGRMARILVEISDPLGLESKDEGQPGKLPLLVGAYVQVELNGRGIHKAIELPRKALRGGDKVYLLGADSRLEIRDVQVIWSEDQSVLIGSGLRDGENVIVSRVASPVTGMLLKQVQAPKAQASQGAETQPNSSETQLPQTQSPQTGAPPNDRKAQTTQ